MKQVKIKDIERVFTEYKCTNIDNNGLALQLCMLLRESAERDEYVADELEADGHEDTANAYRHVANRHQDIANAIHDLLDEVGYFN